MAGRSKAIMHIIKRYEGKRLKRECKYDPVKYEFPTQYAAGQACWTVNSDTGRACASFGKVLTVYT
jgi:hypothetical protein